MVRVGGPYSEDELSVGVYMATRDLHAEKNTCDQESY